MSFLAAPLGVAGNSYRFEDWSAYTERLHTGEIKFSASPVHPGFVRAVDTVVNRYLRQLHGWQQWDAAGRSSYLIANPPENAYRPHAPFTYELECRQALGGMVFGPGPAGVTVAQTLPYVHSAFLAQWMPYGNGHCPSSVFGRLFYTAMAWSPAELEAEWALLLLLEK